MNEHASPASVEHAAEPDYGVRAAGYRLPPDIRLGRVRLQVSDLGRSITFYQTILGLRVVNQTGATATLTAHGDDFSVIELAERKGARSAASRPRLGLFHYAILLPDRNSLGKFVAHLAASGIAAGSSDHLVSEALYLSDPDGLGIEVYADRPRSTWQTRSRQLVMSTLPLDIEDLVRASGGAPWSGMPAGTRIGHVHLHVGDIEQAARFYHETLGLDKVVWSYPKALFLSAGGYHHHLGVNTWAGPDAPRATAEDAQLLEWEIILSSTSDLESALDSLASAGSAVERTATDGVVRDPWGTALRLRIAQRG